MLVHASYFFFEKSFFEFRKSPVTNSLAKSSNKVHIIMDIMDSIQSIRKEFLRQIKMAQVCS